jgi:hypothetical protein
MGRIREYQSQTEVQGPVSAPGRRADPAGMNIGQGLEDMGKGMQDLGNAMYKRQARDEMTAVKVNAGSALEQLQTSFKSKLANLAPGTDPNSDEYKNLMSDYDNEINNTFSEIGQNLTTSDAKDYFNELHASSRMSLMKDAFHDKAQVVAETNGVAFQNGLSADSAFLMDNPQAFETKRANNVSWIAKQVKIGAIDPAAGAKLTAKIDETLGQSAIRGLMRQSPDAAEQSLTGGHWDGIIDGQTKHTLLTEIKTERRAQKYDVIDRERKIEKAKKETQESNYDALIAKFVDGTLSPSEIARANIDPDKKLPFISKFHDDRGLNGAMASNPEKVKNLWDRTLAPDEDPSKITSLDQLDAEYRNGGVSPQDYQKLRAEVRKAGTEDGKHENEIKKSAVNMLDSMVENGAGPKDPKAAEMKLRARREYWNQYEAGIKAGKSVTELTDPDFIKKVGQPFVRPPQVKFQDKVIQHKKFIEKTTGQKPSDVTRNLNEMLRKAGKL